MSSQTYTSNTGSEEVKAETKAKREPMKARQGKKGNPPLCHWPEILSARWALSAPSKARTKNSWNMSSSKEGWSRFWVPLNQSVLHFFHNQAQVILCKVQNPRRSGYKMNPSRQDGQCSGTTVPLFFPYFPRQSRWEIVCPLWQIVQDLTNIGPGKTWSSKIS